MSVNKKDKPITLASLQAMVDSGQLVLPAGQTLDPAPAPAELHPAAPVPLTPVAPEAAGLKPTGVMPLVGSPPVQHIPQVPAPNIKAEMDGTKLVVTMVYETTNAPIKVKGNTSILVDTQRFISLGQGYGLLAKLTYNPTKV